MAINVEQSQESIHPIRWLKRLAILCAVLICHLYLPDKLKADNLDSEIKHLETFSTAYNLIKAKYIQRKNTQELIASAIEGMAKELDPYSALLTAEDLENIEQQSVGQYIGIGVTISLGNDRYVVTQIFDHSPAQAAGIKRGDEIIRIDDIALSEKTMEEIGRILKGEVGESMYIDYLPADAESGIKSITLKRALVKANSVQCSAHDSQIGILTVHQFHKHTARELEACLTRLSRPAYVLDLRNNPGGLLVSAVEVTELFVDPGPIVQIRNRENDLIEQYIARKSDAGSDLLLVVLINSHSASASEIVAGAIKDRGRGVLVGEKSYGKGVVQSIYPISEDLYLKLTTALYYTPSEVSFDGIGLEPDIWQTDSMTAEHYSPDDLVFQKAVSIIKTASD